MDHILKQLYAQRDTLQTQLNKINAAIQALGDGVAKPVVPAKAAQRTRNTKRKGAKRLSEATKQKMRDSWARRKAEKAATTAPAPAPETGGSAAS